MIEQRLFVFQQPVVAAIELVDLGQPEVGAQQIGQRGPFKPFPMQPPLAAWRQQAIGDQHEQFPSHRVPLRLAARRSAQNLSSWSPFHSVA